MGLRVARLFHLFRRSASEAFLIASGARCDDKQGTHKCRAAKSCVAERPRRAVSCLGFKHLHSSSNLVTAGAFGFLTFTQSGDRPER
jgi:hypothetical protein